MGSGNTKQFISQTRSQFESDAIIIMTSTFYKSKSYLERVLRSDRATSAFLKYLDRDNIGYFLMLYLDASQYLSMRNDLLLHKALKQTRSNYSQLSEIDSTPSSDDTTIVTNRQELNRLVTEMLLTQIITETDVKKIEEICLMYLIEELQDFITSSHEFSKRFAHNHTLESNVKTLKRGTRITKRKRILIIDDSPQNSWFISQELKALGHHNIRQANHGWIGAHIASLNHFDIILVDLAMNTMDPYEVVSRIKTTCSQHDSLIIGLNYSEYDLKHNDDVLFLINMGSTESVPKVFATSFSSIVTKFEDISCDSYETCDTSTLTSSSSHLQ